MKTSTRARHYLTEFISYATQLDRQLEATLAQLQLAVREARNSKIQLGGVYDNSAEGLQFPVTMDELILADAEEVERALARCLEELNKNVVTDTAGRRFHVRIVPLFQIEKSSESTTPNEA
jgi:hypothetical protein